MDDRLVNQYNRKVLVSNWQILDESDPKDNNPFNPKCKNYFLSAYKHFGTTLTKTPTSETHDMLKQILATMCIPIRSPKKSILNFLSYPLSEKKLSAHVDKEGYSLTDYRTTTMYDYRPHQQTYIKPPEPVPEQTHKNRIYLSELTDSNSPKRRGINKFLDDNVEDFYRNRAEKYDNYSSYNPGTGKYSNIKQAINK